MNTGEIEHLERCLAAAEAVIATLKGVLDENGRDNCCGCGFQDTKEAIDAWKRVREGTK